MTDLFERLDRWVDYAEIAGLKLARILVHPDDFRRCPSTYRGLPVVRMGSTQ